MCNEVRFKITIFYSINIHVFHNNLFIPKISLNNLAVNDGLLNIISISIKHSTCYSGCGALVIL